MSDQGTIHRLNDIDINMVDVGDGGPVLLFLHYWGGSSRTWKPVMAHLSGSHRCIAFDFHGWGKSGKVADDYGLEALAADVKALVQRFALDDFVIVGQSMGGKVAQLVAADRPVGLKRLVLLAPAPPGRSEAPEAQREAMIEKYQTREGIEEVIELLAARPLSGEHREQIIEDSLRGSPGAKHAWPRQGMIADISERTSRIEIPFTIIVGSEDKIEPEAVLRAGFADLAPQARFTVLEGVGHLAPLEAPGEVAEAIRAALRA